MKNINLKKSCNNKKCQVCGLFSVFQVEKCRHFFNLRKYFINYKNVGSFYNSNRSLNRLSRFWDKRQTEKPTNRQSSITLLNAPNNNFIKFKYLLRQERNFLYLNKQIIHIFKRAKSRAGRQSIIKAWIW